MQSVPGKEDLKHPSPTDINPDPYLIRFFFTNANSTNSCSFSVRFVTTRYLPEGFIILLIIFSTLH